MKSIIHRIINGILFGLLGWLLVYLGANWWQWAGGMGIATGIVFSGLLNR